MGLFENFQQDPVERLGYAREAAMVDASELIAHALEESGMSRSELAQTLDVRKSEITARLAGERNITVRKLAETLHALGHNLQLGMTSGSVGPAMPNVPARRHRSATGVDHVARLVTRVGTRGKGDPGRRPDRRVAELQRRLNREDRHMAGQHD